MTGRPRCPWRVITSGMPGHGSETEHTSEANAYAYLRAEIVRPDSRTPKATVMQWSDGRWQLYEIVHCSELPSSVWFPTPDPA
jgi:hypothetical protein